MKSPSHKKKGSLDADIKIQHTVVAKKTIECERLYEFMIAMFKDKVAGRKCTPKDGMD